jgi:hypothetical protein
LAIGAVTRLSDVEVALPVIFEQEVAEVAEVAKKQDDNQALT